MPFLEGFDGSLAVSHRRAQLVDNGGLLQYGSSSTCIQVTPMRSLSIILASVLLLAIPAAAAPQAVANGTCKPLADPRKLPELDALFDSAVLTASLPATDDSSPAELWISVRPGENADAFVIDESAAGPWATATVTQVLASLRKGARVEMPSFRLRVVPGAAAQLSIDRSILCNPEAQGSPAPVRMTRAVVPGQTPPRPRSVSPRIRIGPSGDVRRVDLGSGSGDRELDRLMEESLRRVRYRPATLDGRPVEVWLTGTRVEIAR
jgi:hypothetical protein